MHECDTWTMLQKQRNSLNFTPEGSGNACCWYKPNEPVGSNGNDCVSVHMGSICSLKTAYKHCSHEDLRLGS